MRLGDFDFDLSGLEPDLEQVEVAVTWLIQFIVADAGDDAPNHLIVQLEGTQEQVRVESHEDAFVNRKTIL